MNEGMGSANSEERGCVSMLPLVIDTSPSPVSGSLGEGTL